MDSSVSPKDEMSFLRLCHHISKAVYLDSLRVGFQLFCLRVGASAIPAMKVHRYVSCQLGSQCAGVMFLRSEITNRLLEWQYLEWHFGVTIFPMHSPSMIYFDAPSSNILNIVHFLANNHEADLASSLLATGSTREM
jgi:hypothetical protein